MSEKLNLFMNTDITHETWTSQKVREGDYEKKHLPILANFTDDIVDLSAVTEDESFQQWLN